MNPPASSNSESQITIISKSFDVKGDLNGVGAVIVSGKIEGNISASQIVVEGTAVILGDITCEQIDISGHVRGLINAADVIIRETASIEGDLNYSSIAMESGSTITGKLKQTPAKQSSTMVAAPITSAQTLATQRQESLNIAFPVELSQKLQLHESRMSAHLSLVDGGPAPAWVNLNHDKLGLSVNSLELRQLQEKNQVIEMRLHVGSQYFDFNLPIARSLKS